jgi:hypothetical protein
VVLDDDDDDVEQCTSRLCHSDDGSEEIRHSVRRLIQQEDYSERIPFPKDAQEQSLQRLTCGPHLEVASRRLECSTRTF